MKEVSQSFQNLIFESMCARFKMISVAQGNREITVKLCLHQHEKLHPFLSHQHGCLKMIWTRRHQ